MPIYSISIQVILSTIMILELIMPVIDYKYEINEKTQENWNNKHECTTQTVTVINDKFS